MTPLDLSPTARLRRPGGHEWSAPVRVPLPSDFDFPWTIGFLSAREVPSLERTAISGYWRSVRIGLEPLLLHVRLAEQDGGRAAYLEVRTVPALTARDLEPIITRMFDLSADLEEFRRCAERDAILRGLVLDQRWIRLPQILDPFEGLIRAILGQQVSVAAASTMTDRLVLRVGEPFATLDDVQFRAFPEPGAILEAGEPSLRGLGLTKAKATAVLEAARAVVDARLVWDELHEMPSEAVDAALTALPGVGPWTAAYVRMRALGDRDAFPASDLGVLKAIQQIRRDGRRPTSAEAGALAEGWRPWRACATLHLWESLARIPHGGA